MILMQITLALNKLMIEGYESIILEDMESVFAEEVAHYLSKLFHELKCDYNIYKINDSSYRVDLLH